MIGKTLGNYEILEPLGAGGMGEVYRARDANLKRDVAIKVLPQDLSADADRLARLEREAHLLASLNHPNIATIFSLEEVDETRFLVLELIDGESLRERLDRGPLPVPEALDVCAQIARALEVAHAEGIVHRDLKPANVLITPDDRVKVLDFGIAKSLRPVGEGDDTVHATELTMAGTLVGTAPYMSPEQVRGEAVDKRSDIWAFGCVFFEALSGKAPFTRETMADTLAAIVGEEPHWESLPAEASPAVRMLLHRCLQKSPKVRQRDIGDAWVEISQSLSHPGGVAMSLPPTLAGADGPGLRGRVAAGLAIAALALGGVTGWWLGPDLPAPVGPIYFDFELPPGGSLPFGSGPTIAISPDGGMVAFVATGAFGQRLFVQRLDEPGEPLAVEGTEDAVYPFFSPDSVWLAFDAPSGNIEAISLVGGDSEVLCRGCRRGAWGDDGSVIVETDEFGNLWARIPKLRAPMEKLPTPSWEGENLRPSRPDVLPGSRAVLFSSNDGIYAFSLDTGEVVAEVAKNASDPYYAGGYVLFPRDNTLYAVPFDVATLSVGEPIMAKREVTVEAGGALQAAVSRNNGVLAFAPVQAIADGFHLGWVSREGVWNAIAKDDERIGVLPRVSPDGRRIALGMAPDPGGVWLFDDRTGLFDPFRTVDYETIFNVNFPLWSRDGLSITYREARDVDDEGEPRREQALIRRPVSGSLEGETLLTAWWSGYRRTPWSWTPDDDRLIYSVGQGAARVLVAAADATERDTLIFEDEFAKKSFVLSHDGEWLSYVSNRGGSDAVYVRRFPAGDEIRVSPEGGSEPRWGSDDRELFYIVDNQLVSAHVSVVNGEFSAPAPHEVLFELTDYQPMGFSGPRYDVHPDGNRFVMIRPNSVDDGPDKVNVVINWFEEIAGLAIEQSQR